jgi:hypothetical protein
MALNFGYCYQSFVYLRLQAILCKKACVMLPHRTSVISFDKNLEFLYLNID